LLRAFQGGADLRSSPHGGRQDPLSKRISPGTNPIRETTVDGGSADLRAGRLVAGFDLDAFGGCDPLRSVA
jgi:hypothetical protein